MTERNEITRTAGPQARRRPAAPRLVRWPSAAPAREAARLDGVPCLLVVERGGELPVVADGEDWVWADTDERDVARRLADLVRRSVPNPAVAPHGGRADRLQGLHPADARVAAILLRRSGRLVPLPDLVDAATGVGQPSGVSTDRRADLARVIRRLRRPLSEAGWRVRSLGGAGYLVEAVGRS